MKLSYPPVWLKFTDDGGMLTDAWDAFLRRWWQKIGFGASSVEIQTDTITTQEDADPLSIQSAGDIYLNGVKWTSPPNAGLIAVVNDEPEISWLEPGSFSNKPMGWIMWGYYETTPSGWVAAGATIGNPSSGADVASDDTRDLYIAIWDDYDNSKCPVSSGRGASGENDFNAGKTLTLPAMAGRAIKGTTSSTIAGTAAGSDTVTITNATALSPSSAYGTMPAHNHTTTREYAVKDMAGGASYTPTSMPYQVFNTTASQTTFLVTAGGPMFSPDPTISTTSEYITDKVGGGQPHNNLQPSCYLNAYIRL